MAAGEAALGGLPLFHVNALIVTGIAPMFAGLRVVWPGPAGYRDRALYAEFWKIVRALPDRGHVRRPHRLPHSDRRPGGRRHRRVRLPIVGAAPLRRRYSRPSPPTPAGACWRATGSPKLPAPPRSPGPARNGPGRSAASCPDGGHQGRPGRRRRAVGRLRPRRDRDFVMSSLRALCGYVAARAPAAPGQPRDVVAARLAGAPGISATSTQVSSNSPAAPRTSSCTAAQHRPPVIEEARCGTRRSPPRRWLPATGATGEIAGRLRRPRRPRPVRGRGEEMLAWAGTTIDEPAARPKTDLPHPGHPFTPSASTTSRPWPPTPPPRRRRGPGLRPACQERTSPPPTRTDGPSSP